MGLWKLLEAVVPVSVLIPLIVEYMRGPSDVLVQKVRGRSSRPAAIVSITRFSELSLDGHLWNELTKRQDLTRGCASWYALEKDYFVVPQSRTTPMVLTKRGQNLNAFNVATREFFPSRNLPKSSVHTLWHYFVFEECIYALGRRDPSGFDGDEDDCDKQHDRGSYVCLIRYGAELLQEYALTEIGKFGRFTCRFDFQGTFAMRAEHSDTVAYLVRIQNGKPHCECVDRKEYYEFCVAVNRQTLASRTVPLEMEDFISFDLDGTEADEFRMPKPAGTPCRLSDMGDRLFAVSPEEFMWVEYACL